MTRLRQTIRFALGAGANGKTGGLQRDVLAFLIAAAGTAALAWFTVRFIPIAVGGWVTLELAGPWTLALLLLADRARWPTLLSGYCIAQAAVQTAVDPAVHPIRPLFFALLVAANIAVLAYLVDWALTRRAPLIQRPLSRWSYHAYSLVVPIPFTALTAWLHVELGDANGIFAGSIVTWLAHSVGLLVLPPMILALVRPSDLPGPTGTRRVAEALLATAAILVALLVSHSVEPGGPSAALGLVVVPALMGSASRCHPLLTRVHLMVVLLGLHVMAHLGGGPIGTDSTLGAPMLQVTSLLLAISVHGVSLVVADQRAVLQRLRDERRSDQEFLASAPEVIFRVGVSPPVSLQRERSVVVSELIERAVLDRHNLAYGALQPANASAALPRPWRQEGLWFDLFLEHIDDALTSNVEVHGLEVRTRNRKGEPVELVASFRGIFEGGALKGVWGMASDVTRLTEAHARLEGERARLRRVVAEWVMAEERERRVLAHSLRAGVLEDIQVLAAAEGGSGPSGAALRSMDARERAQRFIEALDPVELTEGGLRRSLERGVRSPEGGGTDRRVAVDLRIGGWIERLPAPLAVLTYRIARELVDDAEVRPSVRAARLSIDRAGDSLRIRFVEEGAGSRGDDGRVTSARPSLEERVRVLGGLVSHADGEDGSSATLTIEIPIDPDLDVPSGRPV